MVQFSPAYPQGCIMEIRVTCKSDMQEQHATKIVNGMAFDLGMEQNSIRTSS